MTQRVKITLGCKMKLLPAPQSPIAKHSLCFPHARLSLPLNKSSSRVPLKLNSERGFSFISFPRLHTLRP